ASDDATPDIVGSSAAATDIPNSLTGSVYKREAFCRPVTAPVGRKLARIWSIYALTWTTPRLMNTGTKFAMTARTCGEAVSSDRRRPFATRRTAGNWTAHCRALPATEPHASFMARSGSGAPPPNTTSVTIIATFHVTGARYDSRTRLWLLSTPRHQADRTSSPAPGNSTRTIAIVRSRFAPVKPGAITALSAGVATTPA